MEEGEGGGVCVGLDLLRRVCSFCPQCGRAFTSAPPSRLPSDHSIDRTSPSVNSRRHNLRGGRTSLVVFFFFFVFVRRSLFFSHFFFVVFVDFRSTYLKLPWRKRKRRRRLSDSSDTAGFFPVQPSLFADSQPPRRQRGPADLFLVEATLPC